MRIVSILLGLTFLTVNASYAADAPPPKPNFASWKFLLGVWSCHDTTPDLGKPYRWSFAPGAGGYWLVATSPHTKRYLTYDAKTAKWVTTAVTDYGDYGVSATPGWKGSAITFADLVNSGGDPLGAMTLTKATDRHFTLHYAVTTPHGSQSFGTDCTKS